MRLTVCTAVTVLALLAGRLTPADAGSRSKTVKVGDNWFVKNSSGSPKITVRKGTKVRFKFVGNSVHDVVAVRKGKKRFQSKIKSSGSYSKKLRKPGTYSLYCSIHGAADQSMKIVVKR